MKCKRVRKLLTAYVDAELAENLHRSMAEHLEQCEACRRCEGEMGKVLAWAGLWRDREPSGDFLSAVKAKAVAAQRPASWRVPFWLPRTRTVLAGLAAACLVFFLGYLTGVVFSGRAVAPRSGPLVAAKGATQRPQLADAEHLIVGVQKIKMVFGDKLSDKALAQLNEVQLALAARDGEKGDNGLAVVRELQQAEGLVRDKKFAEAGQILASLEETYPEHALAPYARMTRIFTTPQRPGYGSELLNSVYAALLQDTVIEPGQFYNQLATVQAEVTGYGWQKIVESTERLNPLNLVDFIENRLASGEDVL
jgi:hypothetical protein